jgi:hypothetical protein
MAAIPPIAPDKERETATERPTDMEIAGVHLGDAAALNLAIQLRRAGHGDTADLLEGAIVSYQTHVGLSLRDREAILALLVDPADQLAPLRGALRNDLAFRHEPGLR